MIQTFLTYLQYEKNRSSHTVLSYKTDILSFETFLKNERKTDLVSAKTEHVRAWIVSLLKTEGESPRSVNRKISALRTFYNYMLKTGRVQENPMRKISALKTEKNLPVFFRTESVEGALHDDALNNSQTDGDEQFEQLRDKLIIGMLYETGMRRSELINLKNTDIDERSQLMKVLGKGNKERVIPFGENLKNAIAQYKQTKALAVGETTFFFCRKDGAQIGQTAVYRIVRNLMSQHSSLHKCSPHVLRHTFATTLLNEGANIKAVKELLGHASLAATQVYTHLTFEQLQKIYKQAHPRA